MTEYAFQPETSYVQDVNTITDIQEHGDEITYPGASAVETDHATITHTPNDTETIFSEYPGRFFVERIPRGITIGRSRMTTVQLFGDGNPVQICGRNMNRKHIILWTSEQVNPVFVASDQQPGNGVQLSLTGLQLTLETQYELYAYATVTGSKLYVIEEYWNTDKDVR